jgi:CelD/BcsL family acetyltransferase involved in cellulose biosynthesis
VQNFSDRLKGALRHLIGDEFSRHYDPVESNGLRAVCHNTWPTDPAFITAWETLVTQTPFATTFHSPAWQRAVVEVMAKEGRLRLITVWQGAQLRAVLPLSIRDDGLLETLAPGVSDYLDPLIHPHHETQVWPVILKLLAKLRSGKWKNITFHNVRDAATCRNILPQLAAAEGFAFESRIYENCPCITLPKTFDDFLTSLDSHERKETRRKINKATTKGSAQITRCPTDPAEIAKALPRVLSMMEQAPGEKGEAVKRFIRPLLEKAAPTLIAQGKLWLTSLNINNQPAACTLQFPHADGPMLYNCGFDPAKKEWSTGVVLTALIIQNAIESGANVFDLLRGEEPYKYKLGATNRPLWMLNLTKL